MIIIIIIIITIAEQTSDLRLSAFSLDYILTTLLVNTIIIIVHKHITLSLSLMFENERNKTIFPRHVFNLKDFIY